MPFTLEWLLEMEVYTTLQSFFPTNSSSHIGINSTDGTVLDEDTYREHIHDFHDIWYTYRSPTSIALICLYVPLFFSAFVGNLLILVVVLPSKHMRSVTNYFLVNLAVADLLVTLVCVPMSIGQSVYKLWVYGGFLCKFTSYMQGVAVASSVFTIMTLSLDRYLAIRHPVLFRTFSAGKHATRLVIIIWIISFALMVPIIFARQLVKVTLIQNEPIYFCNEVWRSPQSRQIYDTVLFFLMFVMPGALISLSYSRIGCALWTEGNFMYRSDSNVGKAQAHKVMMGRRKIARMLAVVAIVFAVCWMPYHCVTLYLAFIPPTASGNSIIEILFFTLLLGHFNSALNPLLYCFMNKSFRNRTFKILKRFTCTCNCQTHSKKSRNKTANLIVRYKRGDDCGWANVNTLRKFKVTNNTRSSSGSLPYSRSGSQRHFSKNTSNTNVIIEHIQTPARDHVSVRCASNSHERNKMDYLKPTTRLGRRRKSSFCHQLNIPSTINEETSRANSRSPSLCLDKLPELPALLERNMNTCSRCDESHTCASYRPSYTCSCEQCLEESGEARDSDSDSFCDVCADAGLIECCHLTPEPAIRMALMRQLTAQKPSAKATHIPKIKIKVESYA